MTTPALAVDLPAERDAYLQRQGRALIEARAKRLLERAGWKASPAELKREFREWWAEGLMEETLEEAQRLQQESRTTVRHIPVEDYMAKKTDTTKLRQWLRDLFTNRPDISIPDAYALMQKELGYTIKESTFEVTYFYAVRRELRQEGEAVEPPASDEVEESAQAEPGLDEAFEELTNAVEEVEEEVRKACEQLPEPPHQRRIFLNSSPEDCFDASQKENGDWEVYLKVVADETVMQEVRELAWREMFGG